MFQHSLFLPPRARPFTATGSDVGKQTASRRGEGGKGGVGVVGWGGEGGPLAVKEMLVPANQKSRGLPNSGKYISFVLSCVHV